MRMGELLREDGSIEYNTTGVFATGVVQTDEYICAGNGREVWKPSFYLPWLSLFRTFRYGSGALNWIG